MHEGSGFSVLGCLQFARRATTVWFMVLVWSAPEGVGVGLGS